ncbi:hypothetical protein B0T24DRAFT_252594 [Lasiosphaeria ovina]|uniref:Uncharacterized protein n=1 Tax=Lasiosphaeria ovina TaxID=92902 RepID=A0AAE0KBM3_9PEZI|nr:hypothetical protein B0T24DRAFT_252594 [Lasiosphaeria ovina]
MDAAWHRRYDPYGRPIRPVSRPGGTRKTWNPDVARRMAMRLGMGMGGRAPITFDDQNPFIDPQQPQPASVLPPQPAANNFGNRESILIFQNNLTNEGRTCGAQDTTTAVWSALQEALGDNPKIFTGWPLSNEGRLFTHQLGHDLVGYFSGIIGTQKQVIDEMKARAEQSLQAPNQDRDRDSDVMDLDSPRARSRRSSVCKTWLEAFPNRYHAAIKGLAQKFLDVRLYAISQKAGVDANPVLKEITPRMGENKFDWRIKAANVVYSAGDLVTDYTIATADNMLEARHGPVIMDYFRAAFEDVYGGMRPEEAAAIVENADVYKHHLDFINKFIAARDDEVESWRNGWLSNRPFEDKRAAFEQIKYADAAFKGYVACLVDISKRFGPNINALDENERERLDTAGEEVIEEVGYWVPWKTLTILAQDTDWDPAEFLRN